MKIEVNIQKKYFFILLSVVLVLGVVIGVYAFGGNSPAVFGHSAGEIEVTLADGTDATLNQAVQDLYSKVSATSTTSAVPDCRICIQCGDMAVNGAESCVAFNDSNGAGSGAESNNYGRGAYCRVRVLCP